MIRALALLNLIGALLLAPFVGLGLAAQVAPDRTAELIWSVPGTEELETGGDSAVIGGADGPTAVFLASRPSGCTVLMLLVFALLVANTVVLWRLRPRPTPTDQPKA